MHYTAHCDWGSGRFTINDPFGVPRFEVIRTDRPEGSIVSIRSFEGHELAAITPRYGPTRHEITIAAQQPISVRHHGWFGRRYDIATPMGEMSAILSDFSSALYAVTSFGTARAVVSRGPRQRDIAIQVGDSDDVVSLISIVLAIENLRDDRRDNQLSIPFLRLILMMIN